MTTNKLMIERVAEAIFNSQHEEKWDSEREGIVTAMFRKSAEAAIEAMQSAKTPYKKDDAFD